MAIGSPHPVLLPTPQETVWGAGRFIVHKAEPIECAVPSAVIDFLSRFNEQSASIHSIRSHARIRFLLTKTSNPRMGEQGYILTATTSSVTITANTPQGLFYGSQTLIQMMQNEGRQSYFPAAHIVDWPAMPYRGVMVDISRGLVPNTTTFERIVRNLARMKINVVQPYIEDTFAFKSYPFIGRDRGAWTPEEVSQMVKVAKAYYVDMSPCFESLGHMYQILKHPQMADMRETMDVISPAKPETYDFLKNCYAELASAFPFPYLNVGCDETFDLGQGPSKALVDKEGIGRVYADHMMKLDGLCQEFHKTMQFWGDMMLHYPGIVGEMPKDAIVMNWDYGDQTQFPSIATYKSYGYKQIVCPGIQSWGAMFPDIAAAKGNIRGFIQAGKAAGAIGVLNTAWRDNGEVFYDYDWFADAIGAESAWATKPVMGTAFDRGFERCFFGPGSDNLAQAFRLLGDSLHAFSGAPSNQTLQYYYSNPFSDLSPVFSKNGEASMIRLQSIAAKIHRLTDHAKPDYEAGVLPFLQYGADRIAFIPMKYHAAKQIAELYNTAFDTASHPSSAQEDIKQALKLTKNLLTKTSQLRDRYASLWLRENHLPGLQNVLSKYDPSLTAYQKLSDQLNEAIITLKNGKPLPDPASIGLSLPKSTSSGYRLPSLMPKSPSWGIHSVFAIRITLNRPLDIPVPAQILVNSTMLPHNLPHVSQIRLMDQSNTTLSEYSCQVDRLNTRQTLLTFLIPTGLAGNLDFALDTAPAKVDEPVTISPSKEMPKGIWISNSRFRALLGAEGAHIYRLDVHALHNLDVTMPGDTGWNGFDDEGGEREAHFTFKPILRGPLCVQIACKAPDGFEKLLTFFSGAGWYETRFDNPVSFFWNYDDPAMMGSSSPTPGHYRFADGKTGELPAEGSSSIADESRWVAKYRDDGFTLGLISPQGNATLRAGPGGGMGGVGVEGGGATTNLITYADVSSDKWRIVDKLNQSLKDFESAVISVSPIH
jgi:hypothetical protein